VSVRVWRIDREAILARLLSWAHRLGEDENVLAVVLFGSLARGDQTPASDADVLIILQDSASPFEDRIPHFIPTGVGLGVDVFPYTLAETERSLREGWGIAKVALAEGVVLFERGKVLRRLRAQASGSQGSQ